MGTMRGVWARLKPLLEAAMKSKVAPGSKTDPKKTATAIQQFITHFAPIMTELEAAFKMKAQANAKFAAVADQGMKLLQPILQQVDDAHKDGFNADNSLQSDLDGRLGEMIDRLKELKKYGSEVQWG